ncbi:MAG: SoxR reducing system RseC family protein [Prevotellaceae bacterium]|nr:SoxR reducing system RseC family protein [Prevotellaceae bacterium]
MTDKIEHQGRVEMVEDGHVRVSIMQQAACVGCKARSMCTSSENKERIIDVYEPDALQKRHVGDIVNVCGALSMGKTAVRLAFGVPVVIIAVWLCVAVVFLHLGEGMSVGILGAVLAVYFYILYMNRGKMARKFAFWIEDTNKIEDTNN